jgi:bifunctional non-homologous end joining protein LigD
LRQDGGFVIGGCVGAGERFEKLLVGAYQGGAFRYVGEVEFGFTGMRAALWQAFESLVVPRSPFDNLPRKRDAVWLAPRLVAELMFQEWMEGFLRHPCFRRINTERQPEECRLPAAA